MKKSYTGTLYPLGNVTIQNHETILRLVDPYHKALKNLGHFSHLILFSHHNQRIMHHLCKIVGINEPKGIVITDTTHMPDQAVIYDIKPYFPCEESLRPTEHPIEGTKTPQGISPPYQNTLDKDVLPQEITFESKGLFKHLGEQGTLIKNDDSVWNDQGISEYVRVIW